MDKIITLNQNEINIVNGGSSLLVLKNKQDVSNINLEYKIVITRAVVKAAIVVYITAVAVVLLDEINSGKNNQLRDAELCLPTKNFELMMYRQLKK